MNIEQFRGQDIRVGKLGIQPTFRETDQTMTILRSQIHIGHAQTLVAADEICKALGLPLWVRFKCAFNFAPTQLRPDDFVRGQCQVMYREMVMAQCLCEAVNCANALGVNVERFYPAPSANPWDVPGKWLEDMRLNVLQNPHPAFVQGHGEGSDTLACWWDDVTNGPMLLIRGSEWAAPEWSEGTAEYVDQEQLVYAANGVTWRQVTLPAVLVGGEKMAGSRLNTVPWQMLLKDIKRDGLAATREWLLRGIDLDNLPGESTQWDWYNWASAVSQKG